MRNPDRIKPFCDKLAEIWEKECPDWRFGQLICNIQSVFQNDLFYVEEYRMLQYLDEFFERVA